MKPLSAEPSWSSAEHRFSSDHPTAAGHFPGNSIIPGALLLDHVLRTIGGTAPATLRFVKFLGPVHPGDGIEIRWQQAADGQVMFECWLPAPARMVLAGAVTRARPS